MVVADRWKKLPTAKRDHLGRSLRSLAVWEVCAAMYRIPLDRMRCAVQAKSLFREGF